jgi:hypothetical protein
VQTFVALIDFKPAEAMAIQQALGSRLSFVPMRTADLGAGSLPVEDVPIVFVRSERGAASQDAALGWLKDLRRFFPQQEICVVTPDAEAFPLAVALESRVWCNLVLEQALADGCRAIERAVAFLSASPDRSFPERILPGARWHHDTLVSRADKSRLTDAIGGAFREFHDNAGMLYQVTLCTEEALNNSIFHAFRNPDGSEKYRVSRFLMLAPRDRLDVAWGNDGRTFGLLISDNAGTLGLDTLFAKLRYEEDEANLFLERGRGLYLMRSYCHEAYISLLFGSNTTVLLLFHRQATVGTRRPLLIRWELSGAGSGVR